MKIDNEEFKEKISLALKALRKYQIPDNKKATIQVLNSFLPFIGIWILMYFMWDYSKTAVFFLAALNSFFLVRIFIIQHDCGHQSFVKSRKARNIIGYVCSMFSFIPYYYWSKGHHFHHNHNGMLEVRDIGDLDTLTVDEYSKLSKPKKIIYKIYRSVPVMFFIVPIYYVFVHNRFPTIPLPEFKKEKVGLLISNIALAGVMVFLCLILDWQKVLIVHFTTLVFFAMTAIWFFYIQHQHEHGYKHWRNKWDFMIAAIKGSSYYKLPPWLNWLTGNIAIHHIHHLNPAIPNYNLQKSVDAIPWFTKYTTEITFIESLKLASHKLWDEKTERMITFKEFSKKYDN